MLRPNYRAAASVQSAADGTLTTLTTMLLVATTLMATTPACGADAPASKEFQSTEFQPKAQEKIVPREAKIEMLWSDGEFTEGPTPTPDGAILFSDIGNRILRFDPSSGKTTDFRNPSGKSNGLKFDAHGNLIACEGAVPGGNRRISITDAAGNVRTLADRFDGKRFNSPNDLAIGPSGNIYFSDPRYVGDEPRELDFEAVFLVSPQGQVSIATRDVEKPNGIIATPDGKTVYVADNNSKPDGKHQLVAFSVSGDGTLAGKRVVHDFGANRRGIDGMTLDRAGNIYATAGSGDKAGIFVFSPSGEHLAWIATPGDPSNCAFGVGAEAKTLYITGATPKKPDASSRPPYALYRIRLANPGYQVFTPKS